MNKKLIIIIAVVVLLLGGFGIYYYFTNEDDKTTLTVSERQWVEDNKNKLIDLSVPAEIPVLSNAGTGVVFDFLDDLEKDTDLEFNKLSYTDEANSDYAITLTDKVSDNDILLYRDNYILVTKTKVNYASSSDIQNITIGVLESEHENISDYLQAASNINYKDYNNSDDLIKSMSTDDVDAIAVPKLENLDTIISDDNMHIAYNITEYSKDYVLTLGDNKTLNEILTKYLNRWNDKKFEDSFNTHLAETYFEDKEIGEKEQVEFRSKRYTYGFVLNSPFDVTTKDGLQGFNYSFIDSFAKSADIEINYKKYSSIENLINDFNNNELDIIFNDNSQSDYKIDVYDTVSVYDEQVSIISDENNNLVVNSLNSLSDQSVLTVKNSKIDDYLQKQGIKTNTYNNIEDLINHLDSNELAAIDYYSYDYFIRNDIKTFKSIYTFTLDEDYNYLVRDISANETFSDYFDFYLSFTDNKTIMNNSYANLLNYKDSNRVIQVLLGIFVLLILLLIALITSKIMKHRKDHNAKLSKIEKLRYVDGLTSLKNRNYLNDNIKKWDESEVYPQSIIVVDLNNIAYINDNFGHSEGDKVIVEAASILINNQLTNSELVRTSGNEFLIFIVGSDEKEIITYIRKLNKEMKKLSHGFGAAIGYSMIVDEIKTVDDAVNEATIAMRHNKEDRNS